MGITQSQSSKDLIIESSKYVTIEINNNEYLYLDYDNETNVDLNYYNYTGVAKLYLYRSLDKTNKIKHKELLYNGGFELGKFKGDGVLYTCSDVLVYINKNYMNSFGDKNWNRFNKYVYVNKEPKKVYYIGVF